MPKMNRTAHARRRNLLAAWAPVVEAAGRLAASTEPRSPEAQAVVDAYLAIRQTLARLEREGKA
jgi:hypothetical protein